MGPMSMPEGDRDGSWLNSGWQCCSTRTPFDSSQVRVCLGGEFGRSQSQAPAEHPNSIQLPARSDSSNRAFPAAVGALDFSLPAESLTPGGPFPHCEPTVNLRRSLHHQHWRAFISTSPPPVPPSHRNKSCRDILWPVFSLPFASISSQGPANLRVID